MNKLHAKLSKCTNYRKKLDAAEDAKIAKIQAEREK
jgi:hypothetical protein